MLPLALSLIYVSYLSVVVSCRLHMLDTFRVAFIAIDSSMSLVKISN